MRPTWAEVAPIRHTPRIGRGTALDPIWIVPASALVVGFVLGMIQGAGAPTADITVDRLSASLRTGASWSATFGVAGACLGILLSAALLLARKEIQRAQLLAGIASISLFLALLEAGILLYGHAVTECFVFPQILGVFGILLFGYAVALGAYLVVVFALVRSARPPASPGRREWFLPDAASLN